MKILSTNLILACLLLMPSAALKAQTFGAMSPFGVVTDSEESDVAYDPENRVFCVVSSVAVNGFERTIMARLYDENSQPLTAPLQISTAGAMNRRHPQVALHSLPLVQANQFAIVWSERPLLGHARIVMRFILPDSATVFGPPVTIADAPNVHHERPTIGTLGSKGLIAWETITSGETVSRKIQGLHYESNTAALVTTLGPVTDLMTITSGFKLQKPRLPKNGIVDAALNRHAWYMAVEQGPALSTELDLDVRVQSLTTNMTIPTFIGAGSSTLVSTSSLGGHSPDIGVIADAAFDRLGARWLVAYESLGQIRGAVMDIFGLRTPDFAIRSTASDSFEHPSVGMGATEFTIGYARDDGSVRDALYARLDADANLLSVDRPLQTGPVSRVRALQQPLRPTGGGVQNNHAMFTWTYDGPFNVWVRAQRVEPLRAVTATRGSLCAGPGGLSPVIGMPRGVPYPGNHEFRVSLGFAPANTVAYLVIGLSQVDLPIPGTSCNLYVNDFALMLPVGVSNLGSSYLDLPIPALSALEGLSLSFQWAVAAPGFNTLGFVVSNALDVTWTD